MSRTTIQQRTVDCEPFCCPTCARMTSYNPRHLSDSTCEHCGGVLWEDSETWTICEGGCARALLVGEAEHAQCHSLLVYCSDCLAEHARTCLVCGAE